MWSCVQIMSCHFGSRTFLRAVLNHFCSSSSRHGGTRISVDRFLSFMAVSKVNVPCLAVEFARREEFGPVQPFTSFNITESFATTRQCSWVPLASHPIGQPDLQHIDEASRVVLELLLYMVDVFTSLLSGAIMVSMSGRRISAAALSWTCFSTEDHAAAGFAKEQIACVQIVLLIDSSSSRADCARCQGDPSGTSSLSRLWNKSSTILILRF